MNGPLGSKHLKQVARTLQNEGILREGQNWKKKGVNRPDHDCKISGKNRVHGRNELCDGCRLGILEILGSIGYSMEKITKKARKYSCWGKFNTQREEVLDFHLCETQYVLNHQFF